jgi:two-component system, NarL family, nitrate/nitrite response regulator NarL
VRRVITRLSGAVVALLWHDHFITVWEPEPFVAGSSRECSQGAARVGLDAGPPPARREHLTTGNDRSKHRVGKLKGDLPMNVLIVSDVRLHREGLACLLERVPKIAVVGAVDVGGALDYLSRRTTDAVLLDVFSPNGLRIVEPLRRLRRRVRIVAIGVREVESEVFACAAAGIDGYVPVDAAADDLVAALNEVMRRELVCSPKVAASVYNYVGLLRAVCADRELEVIELMNEGLSNKEIARRSARKLRTMHTRSPSYDMRYNLVRIHKRLRVTRAMAAGVTDQLWSVEDLASLAS